MNREFLRRVVNLSKIETLSGFSVKVLEITEQGITGRVDDPEAFSLLCHWDFKGKELEGQNFLDLKLSPVFTSWIRLVTKVSRPKANCVCKLG